MGAGCSQAGRWVPRWTAPAREGLHCVPFVFTAAVLTAMALFPAGMSRDVLAAAASALFEAVPFLALSWLLSRVVPPAVVAYAGCGCTLGPSARSIPAAVAVALAF